MTNTEFAIALGLSLIGNLIWFRTLSRFIRERNEAVRQRDSAAQVAINKIEELRLQRDAYQHEVAKLNRVRQGVEHIKKHELWGVAQNCDSVLKYIDEVKEEEEPNLEIER